MQMRSCGVWLIVLGLIAIAGPAHAAPKKKKHKAANTTAQAEAPQPEQPKSVDDMMDESSKPKASSSKPTAAAEPEEKPGDVNTDTGPDVWEKPPAEEEKPKHLQPPAAPEEVKGDGRHYEVSGLVGYGFETGRYFAVDPYGLAVGVRATYEFDFHLVVGVGYEYYFGSSAVSANTAGVSLGREIKTSAYYMMAHAEVGYNFWFGDISLRPSLWLGAAIGTQNPPLASGTSGVVTSMLLAPGLTLDYEPGLNGWFVGVDAHINAIAGDGASGITLFATGGYRFGS